MRDYPDHLGPAGIRVRYLDAFSNRGFIREGFGCEKLVNDYYVAPWRVVVLGECASGKKRRAQSFEIAGHHLLKVRPFGACQRRPRLCGSRGPGTRTAAQR